MALLEAAASGVPAIATALGGSVELIDDEETGLFVVPGDANALARQMVALIDSPAAVERFGRNAWARARAIHDPSSYLNSLVAIYESAVSRRRHSRVA
jgi:glycosyltransferase involved in cell wall biosynthesis